MDVLSLLRTLGGLGIVLGLLWGVLWAVRRYDIKLPGRVTTGTSRRIELIERMPLDQRRSLALIRRDGREHLILLAPEGPLLIEGSIIRDSADLAAERARLAAEQDRAAEMEASAEAIRESFSTLVDRARSVVRPARQSAAKEVDIYA
jgi:hypothetical protein